MQVILLKKVHNLGDLGEVVNVKPGYGRNFLLPQRLATAANEANLAKVAARRAELERLEAEALKAAQARAAALQDVEVTIMAKAGEEGRLFGSLGTATLAAAIAKKCGVELAKSEINLTTGPLRSVGEYAVSIKLHPDVSISVKIIVSPEV